MDVFDVPGTFEVPQLVSKLSASGRYDAFVALAVLIRGETIHFDCLAHAATVELGRLATERGVPVANGIVMAETVAQADARCGGAPPGKGWDAALAALEMADLYARTGAA